MRLTELVRVAWTALLAHKMRSLLTVLGIVISVWTIVSVLAVIWGLDEFVQTQVIQLSPDVFVVARLAGVISIEGFIEAMKRKEITDREFRRVKELCQGCQMYADDNENVLPPGRMYKKPGGKNTEENRYTVGNGLKYRPRWIATIGGYVGVFAFNEPLTLDKDGIKSDRQPYDNEAYLCPSVRRR